MILSINVGVISGNIRPHRRRVISGIGFSVPAILRYASTSRYHRHNTLDHGNRWARPRCRLLLSCHHYTVLAYRISRS